MTLCHCNLPASSHACSLPSGRAGRRCPARWSSERSLLAQSSSSIGKPGEVLMKPDIGQSGTFSAYHLLEDKFAEDWEGALVEGIGNDPPLEVVEGTTSGVHPQLHHGPGELCAQSCHLMNKFRGELRFSFSPQGTGCRPQRVDAGS